MNLYKYIKLRIILGLVILAVLPLVVKDRYFMYLIVMTGIFVMLSSSWNLLAGYTGLLNLGHAAFYGIGGYTSALLAMKFGLNPWISLFIGGFAAAFFGFLLGIISLRLSGPYFAIATFGFAEILQLVVTNWVTLTNGPLGLYGIPPLTPLKISHKISIGFTTAHNFYYVLMIVVLLSMLFLRKLIKSEFGITLKTIRDDELGAESIGVNVVAFKLLIFIISAFFAGIAGALFAHYQQLISPNMFGLGITFTILIMTMIGGLGTLAGPVVGAIFITFLSEGLRFIDDIAKMNVRMLIYGLLLCIFIIFLREGIVGIFTRFSFYKKAGRRKT